MKYPFLHVFLRKNITINFYYMKSLKLITICFLLPLLTKGQVISTVAGSGLYGNSGDGGPATAAKMKLLYGFAVDSVGNCYVVDQASYVVRKINTIGIINTFAGNGSIRIGADTGNGGAATAIGITPVTGMCVDRSDNLFFCGQSSIRKISTSGIISAVAGNGSNNHCGPFGVAATAAGLVGAPADVYVDSVGKVYYIDSVVCMIDTSGILRHFAGNGSSVNSGDGGAATAAGLGAFSLTGDKLGNIYLAGRGRIRKVNTAGIISTIAGIDTFGHTGDGGLATAAKIDDGITGMVVDREGNLIFVETYLHYIRKISPAGIITTIAGTGVPAFSGDGGPATAAELAGPCQIKVAPNGDLYFTDVFNYRVRRIAAPTTGMSEPIVLASAHIYPNPTKGGAFNLLCGTKLRQPAQVVITSVDGKLVQQVNGFSNEPIPLHIATKGVYLVTIHLPEQSVTEQVVVE